MPPPPPRRRISPLSFIQHVIPPLLLSYFIWAWRRCTYLVARDYLHTTLRRPFLAGLYIVAPNTLIPAITLVFLRLYFLPRTQSVPPHLPPPDVLALNTVFECVPTDPSSKYILIPRSLQHEEHEALGLLATCNRDKCAGRWKPGRARHCTECGTCRAGFDHHCAFFANCLSAPYMPAFLSLCFLTPLTVAILAIPIIGTNLHRVAAAWQQSSVAPAALRWWAWWPSWIVACGPVGRYAVGLGLGWRDLDRVDGGGPAGVASLEMGCLTAMGCLLAIMTFALGYSTLANLRTGTLTIDRERRSAYARALSAAAKLRSDPRTAGLPLPPALVESLDRFAPRHWFFVPVPGSTQHAGAVLPSLPGEKPYDLSTTTGASTGRKNGNVELTVWRGSGWAALLPWNAVRRGMRCDEVLNWPIDAGVRARLVRDAARIVAEADTGARE